MVALARLGGSGYCCRRTMEQRGAESGGHFHSILGGLSIHPHAVRFFIWRWECGPVVLADAIMRLPFDIRKN